MSRELDSSLDVETLGKVRPAIEGEVTMQQLLDAMAHMAHDIDVLRAQMSAVLARAEQAVSHTESVRDEIVDAGRSMAKTAKDLQSLNSPAMPRNV